MIVRRRPRIWTQQPQVAVELDRSNSLTDGAMAIISATSKYNLATGKPLNISAPRSTEVRSAGKALVFRNWYDVGIIETEVLPAIGTDPFVEFWYGNTTGHVGVSGSASEPGFVTGSSSNQIGIYHSRNGLPVLGIVHTWGSTYLDSSEIPIPSMPYLVVAVRRAAGMEIWVNGKFCGEIIQSPTNLLAQTLVVGSLISDGWWYSSSDVMLAGRIKADWSADQVIRFSGNPWQIFAPRSSRRLISSGGVGNQTLTPTLHTNGQTFYSPTVSQTSAPQSLTASPFANSSTIFAPTVQASKTLSAGLFSNAQTFYSPTVTATKTLATSFYSNTQTFYAHVLNQVGGPQNVVVPLFNNTQTFYSPLLSPGAVSVAPSLYANAQTFYSPSVSVGAVSITPSLFTNAQTFYTHILNQEGGPQNVVVPLFSNASTFYNPVVAPGAVSVVPSLYSNGQTFYSLTVTTSTTLTASLFINDNTIYPPIVSIAGGPQIVAPSLFSNTSSFFTQAVFPGLVQLYPARFDNTSVCYAPIVSIVGSFTGSISDEDITRIVQAVLAALNATTIPVDTRKMNGAVVIGTGLVGDDWRGVGVQPQ